MHSSETHPGFLPDGREEQHLRLLGSPNPRDREKGITYLWAYRVRLMEVIRQLHTTARSDDDREVRHLACLALADLSPDPEHGRLYSGQDDTFFKKDGMIPRRKFPKRGYESDTVLLGGSLTGKAIARILPTSCYHAWEKAFTSADAWKAAGFSYIPVEPILSKNGQLRAKETAPGVTRVMCGVLGKATMFFLADHPQMKQEVLEQEKRIVAVLRSLGIEHGDTENLENYCVELHDGKPRAYIIDFDKAKLRQ